MVRHGVVWFGVVWYGMVWHGLVWYDIVWYGMVWYGMVWYGVEQPGLVMHGGAFGGGITSPLTADPCSTSSCTWICFSSIDGWSLLYTLDAICSPDQVQNRSSRTLALLEKKHEFSLNNFKVNRQFEPERILSSSKNTYLYKNHWFIIIDRLEATLVWSYHLPINPWLKSRLR